MQFGCILLRICLSEDQHHKAKLQTSFSKLKNPMNSISLQRACLMSVTKEKNVLIVGATPQSHMR